MLILSSHTAVGVTVLKKIPNKQWCVFEKMLCVRNVGRTKNIVGLNVSKERLNMDMKIHDLPVGPLENRSIYK